MQSLEKRLAALESSDGAGDDRLTIIIRRLVSPGHLDNEVQRLTGAAGQIWTRQPGESEQDLTDRAVREVKRNAGGAAQLIAWPTLGEGGTHEIHSSPPERT